jgi:hypothetical protein
MGAFRQEATPSMPDPPMLAALHIPMRRVDGWYRFIRFSGQAAGFYDAAT